MRKTMLSTSRFAQVMLLALALAVLSLTACDDQKPAAKGDGPPVKVVHGRQLGVAEPSTNPKSTDDVQPGQSGDELAQANDANSTSDQSNPTAVANADTKRGTAEQTNQGTDTVGDHTAKPDVTVAANDKPDVSTQSATQANDAANATLTKSNDDTNATTVDLTQDPPKETGSTLALRGSDTGTIADKIPGATTSPDASTSVSGLPPEHLRALPKVPSVLGYAAVPFSKLSGFDYITELNSGNAGLTGPGADPELADPDNKAEVEELAKKLAERAKLGDKQIPKDIHELNGKKVAIVGYMVPIDFEQGKTNEFVLIRMLPSCFYCTSPMVNEWVEVKTKDGKRFDYNGDDPLLVTGVLEVGAKKEDGFVSSVYRLVADDVREVEIQ